MKHRYNIIPTAEGNILRIFDEPKPVGFSMDEINSFTLERIPVVVLSGEVNSVYSDTLMDWIIDRFVYATRVKDGVEMKKKSIGWDKIKSNFSKSGKFALCFDKKKVGKSVFVFYLQRWERDRIFLMNPKGVHLESLLNGFLELEKEWCYKNETREELTQTKS